MTVAVAREDSVVKDRLKQAPTAAAIFARSAAAHPDRDALIFIRAPHDTTPSVMSYRELAAEIATVTAALAQLGVGSKDGVAIVLPLLPQAITSIFGAMGAGVAFPVNPLLWAEALTAQFDLARAKVVITVGPHPTLDIWNRVSAAVDKSRTVQSVVEIPISDQASSPFSWHGFLKMARGAKGDSKTDRAALLLHTGGTTGSPKLAQLSQGAVAAGAWMAAAAAGFRTDDRILSGLPLFHVGGLIDVCLASFAAGATVALPTAGGFRDPNVIRRVWPMVDLVKATILAAVPTSLAAIAPAPKGDATLATLRSVATGGSPLAPELAKRMELACRRPVRQLYGMTETAGIIAGQIMGETGELAAGRAAPLGQVSIGEPGAPFAPGAKGALYFKGPNLFQGYRVAEGIERPLVDGWMPTGDLAEILPDGEIRLFGRSKDVIIRSGHNIDPLMIEEAALAHPAVRDAAAVGMPDAEAGELPVLYIALHEGRQATEAELLDFVARRVAEPPARPRKVFIQPELPLTPFGKVARYRLRQDIAAWRAQALLSELGIVGKASCEDPAGRKIKIAVTDPAAARTLLPRLGELGLSIG